MKHMKKYFSKSFLKQNILFIIVILIATVLRFYNLGYSDFQGDEIKALYLPEVGQSFFEYIMDQRKGPVQFIITYVLRFVDSSYSNGLLLRFPFALAGLLSVVFFFKLLKMHFGKKIAFYSSMLFATNGFFIAFSRIVQYQSFVILFMILCLYFLTLAIENDEYKIKGIYVGLFSWSVSLLSHYDGIFIAPFVFYLLFVWFKKSDLSKNMKLATFLISGFISLAVLLSFYIPFLLTLSDSTKEYWTGRMTGGVSAKISSSRYLFTVYQPIYAIHIYTVLFVLGIFFISLGVFSRQILKIKKLPDLVRDFFTHTTNLMKSIQESKPRIIFWLLWLILPVLFFEKFVYISGTHIYTYLVPMFVVLAYGLVTLESIVFKTFEYQLVRIFNFLGILVLFAFLIAQSYAVFVDNHREYPWEEEKFLLWTFPKPNPVYHVSAFGFPYFRNWQEIGDFIRMKPEIVAYNTNERSSISRFYVDLEKDTDLAGYYIYIKNPQSFTNSIPHEKAQYWSERYEPEFTLTRFGKDMVRVYVMESGTLEEIIEKGF